LAAQWEELAGALTARPETFIARLLERDQGRLAWLFDTLGRMDGPHQAFAIGPPPGDLRLLYEKFTGFDDGWVVPDTPFTRYAPLDASMVLQMIAVTPDGDMAPPGGRVFWQAVFDDRRATGGDVTVASAAGAPRVTAAWLVDRFKDTPLDLRRAHLDALLFAQRLSAAAVRQGVSIDTSNLVETLSAFPEYEALVVTLERIGFADSRDYAQAVRAAAELTDGFDAPQGALRLAMFQGGIALVARMNAVGTFGAGTARDLCLSLFPLASNDATGFPAAMVRWMETALLPALPRGEAAQQLSAEIRLIDALAGLSTKRPAPTVEWEGNRYRVDLAAAESARLHRILLKLGGSDLDSVFELSRVISGITAPSSSPADVRAQAAKLLELVPTLINSGRTTLFGFAIADTRDALLTRARQLSEGRGDRKSGDTRRSLAAGLAVVLGDVLVSRVYAAAIGDPDASLLLGENPARRHDFTLLAAPPEGPWAVAQAPRAGARSAAAGSLLALDRALARYWLRPMTLTPPVVRPLLWEQELQGLAESVAALDPFELTDQGRDAIAAALRRGRDRIAGAAGRPADLDQLAAAAGVEGWRRRLIRLAATSDPAAVAGYFSLVEVLGLGLAGSPLPNIDAWGPSMRPVDGSLERRMPLRLEWHEMAGRRSGSNLLSTRIADLQLRVAEWLADMKLPAVLASGVVAYAMYDLAMSAQMADLADWLAVLRTVQRLSPDRMADHVSALTAHGPLVPAAK
jgi:hypothetical protein